MTEPVSLLDLYPTLCGLAGVPVPGQCEGQDLTETLRSGASPERRYSTSFYGGRIRRGGGEGGELQLQSSLRTSEWRLINFGPASNWLRRVAEFAAEETELYNHDPSSPDYDPYEWYNVADKHPDVVAELRDLLPPPTTYDIVVTGEGDGESRSGVSPRAARGVAELPRSGRRLSSGEPGRAAGRSKRTC